MEKLKLSGVHKSSIFLFQLIIAHLFDLCVNWQLLNSLVKNDQIVIFIFLTRLILRSDCWLDLSGFFLSFGPLLFFQSLFFLISLLFLGAAGRGRITPPIVSPAGFIRRIALIGWSRISPLSPILSSWPHIFWVARGFLLVSSYW